MARQVAVAVPAPLYKLLDYRVASDRPVVAGARVRVPLGRRSVVGVVMTDPQPLPVAPDALRPVGDVLDAGALLPPESLQLLRWAAAYYQHPIGEVAVIAKAALGA